MATFKYSDDVLPYTPVAAATAGDVVLLGVNEDLVGVVVADLAAGALGGIRVKGACEFATSETTMIQGDAAYYSAGGGEITATNTDTYAGRVAEYNTAGVITVALNAAGS